jgi:hypothetical protein
LAGRVGCGQGVRAGGVRAGLVGGRGLRARAGVVERLSLDVHKEKGGLSVDANVSEH